MPDLCWMNSPSARKLLHKKSRRVLIIKTYFKLRNDRVKLSLTLKCSKAASFLFQIKKPFEEVHSSKDHLQQKKFGPSKAFFQIVSSV